MEKEIYLGYVIKEENNSVQIYFETKDAYKEMIRDAFNVGMKLNNYATLLLQPCQFCKKDTVHLELIKKDIRRTSYIHSVHLFIFQESQINKQTETTNLKLGYVLSGMLQVDTAALIYTPKGTHKFTSGKTNAAIAVFKNDIRVSTVNCVIKNNTIYPNETI